MHVLWVNLSATTGRLQHFKAKCMFILLHLDKCMSGRPCSLYWKHGAKCLWPFKWCIYNNVVSFSSRSQRVTQLLSITEIVYLFIRNKFLQKRKNNLLFMAIPLSRTFWSLFLCFFSFWFDVLIFFFLSFLVNDFFNFRFFH